MTLNMKNTKENEVSKKPHYPLMHTHAHTSHMLAGELPRQIKSEY